ncbi:MAG: glycosyltransferase family 4 protein [Rubripirellula sp.]
MTVSSSLLEDGSTKPAIIDARVVFLTHYIPPYQVRVLQEIAAVVRDFQVLLSTPIEPNRAYTLDWDGLNVSVQNTWTLRRRWKHGPGGFYDPLFVHVPFDTTRRLSELKPDVVMSHELGARSLGAARYCRRNPETKHILCTYMSERTEQGRGWLRRLLRKRLISGADAITYNGPSCRSYLEQYSAPGQERFHFPYAADDRTVYQGPVARNIDTSRHHLLVVGQLSQRKGVLPMLRQAAQYCQDRPNRRLHLTFAGDGPLRAEMESLPRPENLEVKILGNIEPQEVAALMARSGALVAPTLADEWMLAVNEALQAGLPVIGSVHSQAVATLIQNGVNGWQYDPTDEGSFELALDAFFGEPDETVDSMRNAARETVVHRTPRWAATGAVDAIKHVLQVAPESADELDAIRSVEKLGFVQENCKNESLVGLGGSV